MSFLSGVVSVVEQAALAYVTGGASLALESAASSILQQAAGGAISQFGQDLGLDQGSIDDVLQQAGFPTGGSLQGAVDEAGENLGLSPFEQGQVQQQAQQAQDAIHQMLQQALQESGGDSAKTARSGGKGGMSVLQAIAYAMGKQMDAKLNDMVAKANQLGSTDTQSSQYGQLTSQIQADGQELSMLSNAVNSAIKSIGEAGSTMAKKD